jgi:hypothetical protein
VRIFNYVGIIPLLLLGNPLARASCPAITGVANYLTATNNGTWWTVSDANPAFAYQGTTATLSVAADGACLLTLTANFTRAELLAVLGEGSSLLYKSIWVDTVGINWNEWRLASSACSGSPPNPLPAGYQGCAIEGFLTPSGEIAGSAILIENNAANFGPSVTCWYRGSELGSGTGGCSMSLSAELWNISLPVLNPFAPYAALQQAPSILDVPTVLNAPQATSLAADGKSAVVLAYQSKSAQTVTFDLSSSGGVSAGTAVGSLSLFDPNYLAVPNPPGDLTQSLLVPKTYGPDAAGNYTFLALLWAPNAMPVPSIPSAQLTVIATQQRLGTPAQASVALKPPPLLLVHGVWSNAAASGFSHFFRALTVGYRVNTRTT